MKTKLTILLLSFILMSCTKPDIDNGVELGLIAVWYSNCTPSDTNTALISLDGVEYSFDVVRNGNGYISTNTINVNPGIYTATLISIDGMNAKKKTGDLNGAVVVPESFTYEVSEGRNILFQVFCN